jgi:hypothetical protein
MALGREPIYAALYTALRTALLTPAAPGFQFASRRQLNVSAPPLYATWPAFCLVEAMEDYDRSKIALPARVTLTARLYVYTLTTIGDATDTTMTAAFNDLADSVEDAVNAMADATASVTLGGLVQKCWIAGRQVITPPSELNSIATQRFSIDMVLPHSR